MSGSTIIDLPCSEQEHLLFELRRARYGYWLARHILLLCADGFTPTQIAAVLFCSRSSVYRAVRAYRAGALDHLTGSVLACIGERKTAGLFLALLEALAAAYPASAYSRLYMVVDNFGIHKAKAVAAWLSRHRRMELLFLPSDCPKANPIERVFWEVHDISRRRPGGKREGRTLRGPVRHCSPPAFRMRSAAPNIFRALDSGIHRPLTNAAHSPCRNRLLSGSRRRDTRAQPLRLRLRVSSSASARRR